MKKAIVLFLTFALLLGSVFLGTAAYAGTPAESETPLETESAIPEETVPETLAEEENAPSANEKEPINEFFVYATDGKGNRILIEHIFLNHDGTYEFESSGCVIVETNCSTDPSPWVPYTPER